jgi:hypothetical protein
MSDGVTAAKDQGGWPKLFPGRLSGCLERRLAGHCPVPEILRHARPLAASHDGRKDHGPPRVLVLAAQPRMHGELKPVLGRRGRCRSSLPPAWCGPASPRPGPTRGSPRPSPSTPAGCAGPAQVLTAAGSNQKTHAYRLPYQLRPGGSGQPGHTRLSKIHWHTCTAHGKYLNSTGRPAPATAQGPAAPLEAPQVSAGAGGASEAARRSRRKPGPASSGWQ